MRKGNILIGRDGSAITGELLDNQFTIKTLLGRIRLKASAIAWIHMRGTPTATSDEVWLHSGDRLTGTLAGTRVRWRDASGATRVIPFTKVHSIVLSGRLR